MDLTSRIMYLKWHHTNSTSDMPPSWRT